MKKISSLLLLIFPFFCSAFNKTDSLITQLHRLNGKHRINTLLLLSNEYRYTNPDSARLFGFEALKLSRSEKMGNLEAEALHTIGESFEGQGEYQKALKYAFQSLRLRQKLGDQLKIANSLNNIGIVYDDLGVFSLALKYYQDAYRIFKKLGIKEKQAMVISNLGVLFKAHEDYQKAIIYYQEACSLYKELKLLVETAFCETNLGSVYYYTQQYDLSLQYSLRAEKAFKDQNIRQILPIAQANAGMAYREKEIGGKARYYLLTALQAHQTFGNKKETSFCYIQLAKLEQKEGNNADALRYLDRALEIAEKIGARQQIMDSHFLLSKIHEDGGNPEKAYQSFKVYSALKDSVFKKDRMTLITDFQTKYETEKKEQQIKSLHQQSTIQRLELKHRNIQLVIAGILILFTAGISYLLFNRRKLKEQARLQFEINKHQELATRAVLIAEEKERRRIATDLHDGVGQLLSVALMNLNALYNKLKVGNIELSLAGKSVALINETYDEMRTISHQMVPGVLLKTGLANALTELANKLKSERLFVSFDAWGLEERLDEQTETLIYRITQEAVNNVVKHAGATKLDIQLTKDEDGITLTVEDNGKGFDKDAIVLKQGLGLKSMMDRIELLKGTVEFDTAEGRGTLLVVNIPA